MAESPQNSGIAPFSNELLQNALKCIAEEYSSTTYIGDKEASGNVIGGLFVSLVKIAVASKYPDKEFNVDHEYKVLPNKKNCY
jgi:hypothetical protein